jgi:hypothetical protein
VTKTYTLRNALLILAAVLLCVPAARALDPIPADRLDLKSLKGLAEQARTADDHLLTAEQYGVYANLQEEKAQKHEALARRFDKAPKSLLQKRGFAWDTPKRQLAMAADAKERATEAREMAAHHNQVAQSLAAD